MTAPNTAGAAGPAADEVISAVCRIVARMAVRQSVSTGAATFKEIAVRELGIATDQEATILEQWLTAHQGS